MVEGIEYGKCEVCGKEGALQRTYYHYDIKCKCHSPNHFEVISHCSDCKPQEPETTRITIDTDSLKILIKCFKFNLLIL